MLVKTVVLTYQSVKLFTGIVHCQVHLLYLATMSVTIFPFEQLFDFSKKVFQKIGCNEEDALLATRVLLYADLRGVDSHGIARLSGYVRLSDVKRVNACAQIKIIHETPSTATVDGEQTRNRRNDIL